MFGNDLRGKLRANRITQKELAAYLGVGTNAVYAWVNGKTFPTGQNLDRILELFDMRKEDYKVEILKAKGKRTKAARAGIDNSTLQDFDSVKLAEMIGKSGMTRKFLAKEIGVSEASLSNWERGIAKPTLNRLEKLNQYFNVTNDFWKKDNKSTFIPKEKIDPKLKDKVDLAENPYHKTQKPLESFKDKPKTSTKSMNMKKDDPKPEKIKFDEQPYRCDMEIKDIKENFCGLTEEVHHNFENVSRLLHEQKGTNDFFAERMKSIDNKIAELEEKIVYLRGMIDGSYTDKPELEEKSWWSRLWS